MGLKFLIALLACISIASALYSSSSKVVSLKQDNFDKLVKRSQTPYFVEFYAPWCGHCKNLAPEWEKLSKVLDGIVGVGAVDMTTDQAVGQPYDIKGFPTIKFFADDKSNPVDYNGGRTADAMLQFAITQVQQITKNRLSGKKSSGSSSSSSSSSNKNQQGNAEVIVVTDADFDELVMGTEDPIFVEFYAPWCGHCKSLEPTWNQLAQQLAGQVKVAKVDATANPSVANRFGVQGYPTIKFFPGGKKSDNRAVAYEGGRDLDSLTNYALDQKKKSEPIKFEQLTEQSKYDKFCADQRGVCLIGFLPHIYDSSADERNAYIKIMTDAAEKYKGQPVSFLWSQAGDQYELEDKFALGSGFPAMLAINHQKNVSVIMRKAFTKENISSFIGGLISGQESIQPIRQKIPSINKVSPWDGKDIKPKEQDL